MDVKGVKVDQLSGHWLATGTRLTLVKRLCQLNPPLPPTCSATSPPGQCLFMFVELGLFMTSWKYLKNLAQFVLGSNKHVCTLLICAWYVCTYTTYRCQVFLCVCVCVCVVIYISMNIMYGLSSDLLSMLCDQVWCSLSGQVRILAYYNTIDTYTHMK